MDILSRKIADYIIENLTRVRHTTMKLSMVDNPEHIPEPEFQEINGTCASVRLDALIDWLFRLQETVWFLS